MRRRIVPDLAHVVAARDDLPLAVDEHRADRHLLEVVGLLRLLERKPHVVGIIVHEISPIILLFYHSTHTLSISTIMIAQSRCHRQPDRKKLLPKQELFLCVCDLQEAII